VACDELYGDNKPILLSNLKHNFKLGKDVLEERPLLDRLALHAFSLRLKSLNGEELYLEAPVPKDLMAVLQQLKKLRK
jgi:23S rRNA pseudouridine955/2504/2580 synthase/23S rRNA pseudouridine1911/1915/1917 synthase